MGFQKTMEWMTHDQTSLRSLRCHGSVILAKLESPPLRVLVQFYCLCLEHAVMKCLNLIGQYEGSKSLRATIRGLYM